MTILFDFDGVVVDTIPLHYQSWKKVFEPYTTISFDEYINKIDGKSRIVAISTILPGIDDKQINMLSQKKQKIFTKMIASNHISVYETSIVLLKELNYRGVCCGLVSSSKNCKILLKKLDLKEYFSVVISGTEIPHGRGKPHPDAFILGMEELSGKPETTIVIEDSLAGILAAKKARMKSVAVNRHGADFGKVPDRVVNDLSELKCDDLLEMIKDNFSLGYGALL